MSERNAPEDATEWWDLVKLVRLCPYSTIGKQEGEVGPLHSNMTM